MLQELEQASKNQVGKMNLSDPDQKAHFEKCFKRFYTKQSVSAIKTKTLSGVNSFLDPSEARPSGPPPSNIPLNNEDNWTG
jgi:hypothetical protein